MKKFTKILVLILALAMIFCSCGNSETETESTGSSANAVLDDGSFNASVYHDDNGKWEGITATDYLTMGEYKGLSITGVEPSDSDILSEIDALLESYTTSVPVFDRAIEEGDSVNIDYVGYVDGVAFDGGDTRGAGTVVTAGATNYIDDFLTQIIGHVPGDEFDINVTFPDDYGVDELNGKDAVFKTTINYITEDVVPEYNDDDIAGFIGPDYGVKTCDELYAFIQDALRENNINQAIEDALLENFTVNDIPDIVMDYQKLTMEDYYTKYAAYYSMDLNTFLLNYVGAASIDELCEMYEENMQETSRLSLILQAIAETEGLTITEDEALSFLKDATGAEDVSSYVSSYGINYIKMIALQDKVIDTVADSAVVE